MFRLKGCPRCEGDILLDRDEYGWYEHCLQCGYQRDLQDIVEVQQQAKSERRIDKNVLKKGA